MGTLEKPYPNFGNAPYVPAIGIVGVMSWPRKPCFIRTSCRKGASSGGLYKGYTNGIQKQWGATYCAIYKAYVRSPHGDSSGVVAFDLRKTIKYPCSGPRKQVGSHMKSTKP